MIKSFEQIRWLFSDLSRAWCGRKRWQIILLLPFTVIFYPQYWSVISYRIRRAIYLLPHPFNRLLLPLRLIINSIFKLVTKCEISERANIGRGFTISHVGTVIISGEVEAGINMGVRQGVTIGGKANAVKEKPVIGDNVTIGAGAVIIGNVKIGNNVVVGANSVVTKDIEENNIAAGVPARVIGTVNKGSNNA